MKRENIFTFVAHYSSPEDWRYNDCQNSWSAFPDFYHFPLLGFPSPLTILLHCEVRILSITSQLLNGVAISCMLT